jgi:hypothetical protein
LCNCDHSPPSPTAGSFRLRHRESIASCAKRHRQRPAHADREPRPVTRTSAQNGQSSKGAVGKKTQPEKLWTESTRVNIGNELSARGARRNEINSIASGCAGYVSPGPKTCITTDSLFYVVTTGKAAGTDNSGSSDEINPNLVGKIDFNESGGIILSETYSYQEISSQEAKNFESNVESAWSKQGGSVDLRMAGEGETADLMLNGITNRQMAENMNMCNCMAAAFVGAHNQKPGVININKGTPLPQHATMPQHEYGHNLGLKHRDNGVMSYTGKTKSVRKEDLQAVRKIYSR